MSTANISDHLECDDAVRVLKAQTANARIHLSLAALPVEPSQGLVAALARQFVWLLEPLRGVRWPPSA